MYYKSSYASMRQLASIQRILELNPIENAEFVEVAKIQGWNCVVRKGDFRVGDLVVYFEVDSLIPPSPELDFLGPKRYVLEDGFEGYRIKTRRIRGVISQGLVMRVGELMSLPDGEYKEEQDITDLIGVRLWVPITPAILRGRVKGNFPSFCLKTDETRVQNLRKVLARNKGEICYVTEKVDGSSITCYLNDGVFGVCSRNMDYDTTDNNSYVLTAKRLGIEEKMRELQDAFDYKNFAIQGELCGPGIQKNTLGLQELDIYWFNLFNIDEFKYAGYNEFVCAISYMQLKTVPVLATDYELDTDIEEIVKYATRKSVINPKSWAEGVVIRPVNEKIDLQMSLGHSSARLSFKAINPEYLLKTE